MYKNHIVLDFEMNPVAKEHKSVQKLLRNEIIEMGAVMLNENYDIVDKFVCYICPQYNNKVTSFITNLTGIKTSDVYKANTFQTALKNLSEWIGEQKGTRIYSWSDVDLKQLKKECSFKEISFPKNMHRWIDLQAVYPRITGLSKNHEQTALKTAAEQFGLTINQKKLHTALYDAELTSEILIPILTGDYCKQVQLLKETRSEEKKPLTQTLGDTYSTLFKELLKQLPSENEQEL